ATKKTEPRRFASCNANAAEPDLLLPRCLQHYCCFVTPCGGTSCQADEGHPGLWHQCGASGARGPPTPISPSPGSDGSPPLPTRASTYKGSRLADKKIYLAIVSRQLYL